MSWRASVLFALVVGTLSAAALRTGFMQAAHILDSAACAAAPTPSCGAVN